MERAIASPAPSGASRTVPVLDLTQASPSGCAQSTPLPASTLDSLVIQLKLQGNRTLNLEFVQPPESANIVTKKRSFSIPDKFRYLRPSLHNEEIEIQKKKLLFSPDEICGFLSQESTELIRDIPLDNISLQNLELLKLRIQVVLQSNYLYKGYINSVVKKPPSETIPMEGELLKFEVVEGEMGEVRICGLNHLRKPYIRNRLQQGIGTPLNINDLEEQLRLLREDPAIDRVEAVLKAPGQQEQPQRNTQGDQEPQQVCPGQKDSAIRKADAAAVSQQDQAQKLQNRESEKKGPSKSDLEVNVVEAKPFTASISIDNLSPPSVGSIRFGGEMQYRNLGFSGDSIRLFGYTSETAGNRGLDLSYQVPLNPMNGVLQLRWAPNWNKITERDNAFRDLGIRGRSDIYEVNYRQPLFVRTIRDEFALSLGFTVQNGQIVFLEETPFRFDNSSRAAVIRLSQDYLHRTAKSAFLVRSQFNIGTDAFGLFNPTKGEGRAPGGYFFSWLGQTQWVRKWSRNHLSLVQADLQLAGDSLLPSQQFIVGGGQSLRGYRQNALARDNGIRATAEWRITLWDLERDKLERESFTDEIAYLDSIPDDISVRTFLNAPYPKFCQSPNAEWILNTSYTKSRCQFLIQDNYAITNRKCDEEHGCDEAISELYKLEWLPPENNGGIVITFAPFLDGAFLWNQRNNPTPVSRQQTLLGIGIGIGVESRKSQDARQPSFSMRLDFGFPLISFEKRSSDLQDIGLYFSIRYQF